MRSRASSSPSPARGKPVRLTIFDEMRRLRAKYREAEYAVSSLAAWAAISRGRRLAPYVTSEHSRTKRIMQGFGWKASSKSGIERRVTAGEHKSFLDPFLPMQPRREAHSRTHRMHQQFSARCAKAGEATERDAGNFRRPVWTERGDNRSRRRHRARGIVARE